MKNLLLAALSCTLIVSCTNEKPAEKKVEDASVTAPPPAEFADMKYTEVGKRALDAFSTGNMDVWMSMYADNAVYQWNAGDSLAGKAAIDEFWRKRRSESIDTIIFSNPIFLPIKVNQPQSVEAPGVWLLVWYQIDVTYFNGNRVVEWVHADYHFDANNKVDRVIQYIDRVPINAAMAK